MNHADYQELLCRYLEGAVSSREFQNLYLEKFKTENRRLPEDVFDVLDALFADVDAFCPDAGLLAELNRENPGHCLDEQALRHSVGQARERLKEISITQAHARVV